MITRETIVTQSVQVYAEAVVRGRGYGAGQVEFSERFPYEMKDGLKRQVIAAGFDFDDDGEQAEMGSDLKHRIYNVEFFVFGTTNTWARNLANALKFGLDAEGTIPLLDVEQDPPVEFDRLTVIGARADRQIVPDPEPFQEFVWLTSLRVEDCYYASLT